MDLTLLYITARFLLNAFILLKSLNGKSILICITKCHRKTRHLTDIHMVRSIKLNTIAPDHSTPYQADNQLLYNRVIILYKINNYYYLPG